MSEIRLGALVRSAVIATVLSQVIGLVLMGLMYAAVNDLKVESVAAVFALPMTLVLV